MTTRLPPKTNGRFGALSALVKDHIYALGGGALMFTSAWAVAEVPVQRTAAVVAMTTTRQPIEIGVGGVKKDYSAVLIKQGVKRTFRAENIGIVNFQVDPSHPDFYKFRVISSPGILALDREAFAPFDAELEAAYQGTLNVAQATDLHRRVLDTVLKQLPPTAPPDARLQVVIELLRKNHNYPLQDLAKAVGLSYHRLSHLFANDMGLTLRSYQVWRKIRLAIALLKSGHTLTAVAHGAGFSDSAHLTRAFQQTHAAPPSYFLNSEYVKIISALTAGEEDLPAVIKRKKVAR